MCWTQIATEHYYPTIHMSIRDMLSLCFDILFYIILDAISKNIFQIIRQIWYSDRECNVKSNNFTTVETFS